MKLVDEVKQGDELILVCQYDVKSSEPDPIPANIASGIKHQKTGASLKQVTLGAGIEIIDTEQRVYQINYGDTEAWPLGIVKADIKYSINGVEKTTDTFYFKIIERETD